MPAFFRSVSFISLVLISLLFIAALWNKYTWDTYASSLISTAADKTSTNETSQALYQLSASLRKNINQINRCEVLKRDCALLTPSLEASYQVLERFKFVASQEKKDLNLVGAIEYTELEIALAKYKKEQNMHLLYPELLRLEEKITRTYDEMLAARMKQIVNSKTTWFDMGFGLFISLMMLCLAVLFFYTERIKKLKKEYDIENRQFNQFAAKLNTLTQEVLAKKINDLTIHPDERKIYSHLYKLHQYSESEKQCSNLHQALYSLIGNEMRGICNTLEGGVNLLIENSNEKNVLMAKELLLTTNTLSDLADNYNRLVAQGASDDATRNSLSSMLSALVMHLKSKAQAEDIQFECWLEDNLPELVNINATRLFWVLFLKLSNAMSKVKSKQILLHVFNRSAEKIEKNRLHFELVFFEDKTFSLESLSSDKWQLDTTFLTQDTWASELLKDTSDINTRWYRLNKAKKKLIELDLTPISFIQADDTLDKYNVLLCAETSLQAHLIQEMLTRYHCSVTLAKSANDVFRCLPKMNQFNAIIVTDLIKGIELRSFCKTLKSGLKAAPHTLLLLAISNAKAAQNAHQFVDDIYYTPLLPFDFIPHLSEAIKNAAKKEPEHQERFLIVEDDALQQYLFTEQLKKFEAKLDCASSGEKALEYIKQNPVDLIFMDCIMPGIGGVKATKMIRAFEEQTKKTPPTIIIGSTALSDARDHQVCIEAGMDHVINKPYKSDDIEKVIKKYLAAQKVH